MEENKPLISIIVPVYNIEKELPMCIDSLLAQTYSRLEIILVNDGSSDSSKSICDDYVSRFDNVRVIHKSNGGLSSARNAGIKEALGEYIGFVDGDDTVFPNMYETLYDLIKGRRRAIACASTVSVDAEGNESAYYQHSDGCVDTEEFLTELLLPYGDCSAWSKLYPRELFSEVCFREGRLNEDVLFMFESAEKYDTIVYSSVNGYRYYVRSGSISRVFGKAIHDMITNAHEIRMIVAQRYPSLELYAERYEIYQNMRFLKKTPPGYDRNNDPMYAQALGFIRKNRSRAYKNPYLSKKDKAILTVICFAPKTVSRFYYKRSVIQ